MTMIRTAPATLRSGNRPNLARLFGKRLSAGGVPAGTSSARSCPCEGWAATSVERLRNFRFRLTSANFPPGASESMAQLARETIERMKSALEDDLNTAQAQAAIFEMVRKANAAIDSGEIRTDDAAQLLAALEKFDEIFAVLKDDDVPKMNSILDWARAEAREKEIGKELIEIVQSGELSDAQVNQKIVEMD